MLGRAPRLGGDNTIGDESVREDAVPLSEEELRLLEQMERALAAEDPKFVSVLQGHGLERTARLRVAAASVVFVAGLAVLFVGAFTQLISVMVLGFLIMLGSATLGLHAWRGRHVIAAQLSAQHDHQHETDGDGATVRSFHLIEGGRRRPRRHQPSKGNRAPGGFMRRVEERWQRRRDRGGF